MRRNSLVEFFGLGRDLLKLFFCFFLIPPFIGGPTHTSHSNSLPSRDMVDTIPDGMYIQ